MMIKLCPPLSKDTSPYNDDLLHIPPTHTIINFSVTLNGVIIIEGP